MTDVLVAEVDWRRGVRVVVDGVDRAVSCGRHDTLLRATLRHGIAAPYECNVGSCGTCKVELLGGEVETLRSDAPGLTARDRARGRLLGCQTRPLSDCRIRFLGAMGEEPLAVTPKIMPMRLTGVRPVTYDICEFTFQAQAPARFRPGQYALVHVPGVAAPRAYSMSNLPNEEGVWQFMIRRVPGGAGTTVLFDGLCPGAPLEVDGPYGHGWLREPRGRDVVCIAGGSGVAPMLSIARSFAGDPAYRNRSLYFFFGGRQSVDICSLDELPGEARLTYLPVVSDADEPADRWSGARGFVHEHVSRTIDRVPDYDYYLAGPPPMIDASMKMLRERQVPLDQIHYDRFF